MEELCEGAFKITTIRVSFVGGLGLCPLGELSEGEEGGRYEGGHLFYFRYLVVLHGDLRKEFTAEFSDMRPIAGDKRTIWFKLVTKNLSFNVIKAFTDCFFQRLF